MCKAFSGIVKENGDILWEFGKDSHEYFVGKHKLKDDGSPRDWARFEIAPDNGSYLEPDNWTFRLDEQPSPIWFSDVHKAEANKAHGLWLKKLNKILVHKPIVHPFKEISPPNKITKIHLDLLRQWDSIWSSVRDSIWSSVRASVGDSVGDSVWDSVGASVWASVGASVWASVWDSVGASVGASVWASVGASVRASVRDSVWAYSGSFFNLPRTAWQYTDKIKLPKGQSYPFQAIVDLWMEGLVPSFDGKLWRLHGGKDAKVLWEGKLSGAK